MAKKSAKKVRTKGKYDPHGNGTNSGQQSEIEVLQATVVQLQNRVTALEAAVFPAAAGKKKKK